MISLKTKSRKSKIRISGIYAYKSRQVASRKIVYKKQDNKRKKFCLLKF